MEEDIAKFPLDSFSTAIALIPPEHIQARINGLRNGNDKSYPRWTAHFTFLFPFVAPNLLANAVEHLQKAIKAGQRTPFQIKLVHVRFNFCNGVL
jgi:2'-5' RNA ligase